jgi:beta-glucosidase
LVWHIVCLTRCTILAICADTSFLFYSDGIESLKAGMDLEMPVPAFRGKRLMEAAASGEVSQEELDRAVLSVLRFLERSKAPAKRPAERATDDDAERCRLLRQTAAESAVLLKNDSSKLPLKLDKGGSLAVIGALATDRTVSHLSSPSYIVSPLEGIQSALKDTHWTVKHAHGPPANVLIPLIDHRYTRNIDFHLWNRGQRNNGSSSTPVTTESHPEAKIAFLMRKVDGLDSEFEIEMSTEITVPHSGNYTLGVVSASDAEVYVDGKKVFTFTPAGPVDVQVFLFYQHTFEQTFTHYFEADRSYHLSCISQSQKQSGPEPLATGLFFGMMEEWDMQERVQESVDLAVASDETVVFVGNTWEWEMEGIDRVTLELPRGQRELLEAVIKAKNGDVVVVNQSGAAVDLSCAQGAKAILHAHYGGQEAGNGVHICSISLAKAVS